MIAPTHREILLAAAGQVVRQGVNGIVPTPTQHDIERFPQALQQVLASFVTLDIDQPNKAAPALRGCIGVLSAIRPLIEDVMLNAYSAAFRDQRFRPVTASELDAMHIHISVLSPAEPMQFSNQADLINQLKPGEDGLILSDGRHRGTFLPSVWEKLPEPQQFLNRLKGKAGLPMDYWSDEIQVSRYRTESFGRRLAGW